MLCSFNLHCNETHLHIILQYEGIVLFRQVGLGFSVAEGCGVIQVLVTNDVADVDLLGARQIA